MLYSRPTAGQILAGDAVQVRSTAAALRTLGVEADAPESGAMPDPGRYELVHLFNLMPIEVTYEGFRAARAAGKPVILSTVFWDPSEFLARCDPGGGLAAWWRRTAPLRRETLAGAAAILPNSQAELDCLRRCFPSLPPAFLVPNGVDPGLFHPRTMSNAAGTDVLCAGRISVRKNQLALIEALRGTGLSLKFIGPVNDYEYYRACRAAAWSGVSFQPELKGLRLAMALAAAPVHALVSWYETPGLSSLEAAASGCRVVSTDRGCAREYLGEEAWYCDPGDGESIRRAVLEARRAPAPPGLAERVRRKYAWIEAGRATLKAYEEVLGGGRPGRQAGV